MQSIKYSNRFGTLTLNPVTNYVPVSSIVYCQSVEAQQNTIDIETAEKVALITENANVQLCMPMKLGLTSGFVIHHKGPSVACVCKVDIESFTTEDGNSPAEQIDEMATPKYLTRCFQ